MPRSRAQDVKIGGAIQNVKDAWNFPVYPHGLLIYLNDTRLVPLVYVGTTGTGFDTVTTNLVSGFAQTELRPSAHVSVNLGLRYDLDTQGNNPDFTSPQMPTARGRDGNNIQPRAGFSWDIAGNGRHVVPLPPPLDRSIPAQLGHFGRRQRCRIARIKPTHQHAACRDAAVPQ